MVANEIYEELDCVSKSYKPVIRFREFADSLIKLDKKWVKDKTNLTFKEAKNYFSYVKEKLDSAK